MRVAARVPASANHLRSHDRQNPSHVSLIEPGEDPESDIARQIQLAHRRSRGLAPPKPIPGHQFSSCPSATLRHRRLPGLPFDRASPINATFASQSHYRKMGYSYAYVSEPHCAVREVRQRCCEPNSLIDAFTNRLRPESPHPSVHPDIDR
jgi:hypothetical protein